MQILIYAINKFAGVLTTLLIIRAILSWFVNPYQTNVNSSLYKFNMVIIQITEPIVAPFRRILSRYNTGMFDFSIIFAFFAINIIAKLIVKLLIFAI
ncbi:YggT family protein [Anaerovorax odorimutans]|uniref:YggT family protein n=1 Tax=Anaerovorax odorimutans TaxID=109327 RepID=UPI000403FE78|nr:YggT family protein [Anaerovorax odorimutans]